MYRTSVHQILSNVVTTLRVVCLTDQVVGNQTIFLKTYMSSLRTWVGNTPKEAASGNISNQMDDPHCRTHSTNSEWE